MRAAKFTAAIAALCAFVAIGMPHDVEVLLSRGALDVASAVGIALAVWSRGRWGKLAAIAALLGATSDLLAPAQITGDAQPLICGITDFAWFGAALGLAALAENRGLAIVGGLFALCGAAFTAPFALDTETAGWLAAGALGRVLLVYALPAPTEAPASDDVTRAFAWVSRGFTLRIVGICGAAAGYKLGVDSAIAIALGGAWVASFACEGIGALKLARTRADYAPQVSGTASLMALGFIAAASLRAVMHIPLHQVAGAIAIAMITADLALLTSIARIDDKLRARVRPLRWAYLPVLCCIGWIHIQAAVGIVMLAVQLAMLWAARAAANAIEPGLPPARIQS